MAEEGSAIIYGASGGQREREGERAVGETRLTKWSTTNTLYIVSAASSVDASVYVQNKNR